MAMGYEPEDLPWEVPLIELGLDSLMAVRIKNRVEYDFDLPPIQLTAVRDANLYNVEKLIEYAIEHRDEVRAACTSSRRRRPPRRSPRSRRELLDGKAPMPPTLRRHRARAGRRACGRSCRFRRRRLIPSGPVGNGQPNLAGAAEALNQEAVAKALNSDMPPRDAAERVTFATWAIVTGKSPGGIFNPLPKLDDDAAAKMAERLSERAEGPITVEDVLTSPRPSRSWPSKVRDYLEAGEIDGFVRTLRARPEGWLQGAGVRVPPRRRLDGGVRAAAQPAAGGHSDVRLRAGRGHRSKSVRRSTFRSCSRCRATGRTSWPAGRWAVCWPTPARSG